MTSTSNEKTTGVEISRKLVFINSMSSLVALGLNMTVLVWLQRFLLHRIDTAEYSVLPVLFSVMMFVPLLTTTFTRGLARYATEAYAANDTDRVTQIASTMSLILFGVGLVVLSLGLAVAYRLDSILTLDPAYADDARLMFALLMAGFAVQIMLEPFSVGLEVKQRFVLFNAITTGGQFLRIAILIGLLFGISVGVLWVVVASVTAAFITQLVILACSLRFVPYLRFKWSAVNRTVARQLLTFGGWSTFSAVAITITRSSDAVILNKLGTPLDVTCFYLGALPFQYINLAGSAALTPLRPAMVSMYANNRSARFGDIFLQGGRWALWLTLFISVPLMVCGRELITLYVGAEFQLAGTVMLLVLLQYPVGQGVRMLFQVAEATANIRRLSVYLLAMSLFNLGLTLYLVGVLDMGALGSGIGSAVAALLFYPLLLWPLGFKLANVNVATWIRSTFVPGLLPAAVAVPVLIALRMVVPLDSWINLLACFAAASIAYLAVLWLAALRPEDRRELAAVRTKLAQTPLLSGLVARRDGSE